VDNSKTGRKRLVVYEQNFTSYQLPSSSLRQQQTTRFFEMPRTQKTGIPYSTAVKNSQLANLIILQEVYTYREGHPTTARTEAIATILRRLEKPVH
jgi:hypothetical protein